MAYLQGQDIPYQFTKLHYSHLVMLKLSLFMYLFIYLYFLPTFLKQLLSKTNIKMKIINRLKGQLNVHGAVEVNQKKIWLLLFLVTARLHSNFPLKQHTHRT